MFSPRYRSALTNLQLQTTIPIASSKASPYESQERYSSLAINRKTEFILILVHFLTEQYDHGPDFDQIGTNEITLKPILQ